MPRSGCELHLRTCVTTRSRRSNPADCEIGRMQRATNIVTLRERTDGFNGRHLPHETDRKGRVSRRYLLCISFNRRNLLMRLAIGLAFVGLATFPLSAD